MVEEYRDAHISIKINEKGTATVSGNIDEIDEKYSSSARIYVSNGFDNNIIIDTYRGIRPGYKDITREWSKIADQLRKGNFPKEIIDKEDRKMSKNEKNETPVSSLSTDNKVGMKTTDENAMNSDELSTTNVTSGAPIVVNNPTGTIVAFVFKNRNRGQITGIKFAMLDKNGIPMVDADKNMASLSKTQLVNANDYNVLDAPLDVFDMNISIDEKKQAFKILTALINNATRENVYDEHTMPISETYNYLIANLEERAKYEQKDASVPVENRRYRIDDKYVWVIAPRLKDELKEINSGYSPENFCRAVGMVENATRKQLILKTPGRWGYTTSINGKSVRYYVFARTSLEVAL